jgi:hypothetical protein
MSYKKVKEERKGYCKITERVLKEHIQRDLARLIDLIGSIKYHQKRGNPEIVKDLICSAEADVVKLKHNVDAVEKLKKERSE